MPSSRSLLALLCATTASFGFASAQQQQQRCNGFEELCDRSLGNITFVGAHNSYATTEGVEGETVGAGASSNQYLDVNRQLADGIRMLQGQGHPSPDDENAVQLCHTYCSLLDGGSLTSYLQTVREFLDANPDEVLILLWVNSKDMPVSSWAASYTDSGLEEYSYVPPTVPVRNTEWPTLAELIESGKRVVSFIDGEADDSVPYILDEFTNLFETRADPPDDSFPCDLDRPRGGSPDGLMYLVNHNLNTALSDTISLPDVSSVNTTNAACGDATIQQSVSNCVGLYDRNPNIILLDYYNLPANQPFQVADYLNGVAPNPCGQNSEYIGNTTEFADAGGSTGSDQTTGGSTGSDETSGDPTASPTSSSPSDTSESAAATSSGAAVVLNRGASLPLGMVAALGVVMGL